jgi:hypothetical protein
LAQTQSLAGSTPATDTNYVGVAQGDVAPLKMEVLSGSIPDADTKLAERVPVSGYRWFDSNSSLVGVWLFPVTPCIRSTKSFMLLAPDEKATGLHPVTTRFDSAKEYQFTRLSSKGRTPARHAGKIRSVLIRRTT